MKFERLLALKASAVEAALKKNLCAADGCPPVLSDALVYSISAGGKRLRPALLLFTAEAFGMSERGAMPAACAIELVHTYSLIHDDLPAMDDDDLRRGKPSSHKIFGEAAAILAGDALLTYAFEVCADCAEFAGAEKTLAAISCLSRAAGACGMVGGQAADIFAEGILAGKTGRIDELRALSGRFQQKPLGYFVGEAKSRAALLGYIHSRKTGALLSAAASMGAILAGAGKKDSAAIKIYGDAIGLAFQIADDVLDAAGDEKKLGKKGSDLQNGKLTFATVYGVEKARKKAAESISSARLALSRISGAEPAKLEPLSALADFISERSR